MLEQKNLLNAASENENIKGKGWVRSPWLEYIDVFKQQPQRLNPKWLPIRKMSARDDRQREIENGELGQKMEGPNSLLTNCWITAAATEFPPQSAVVVVDREERRKKKGSLHWPKKRDKIHRTRISKWFGRADFFRVSSFSLRLCG